MQENGKKKMISYLINKFRRKKEKYKLLRFSYQRIEQLEKENNEILQTSLEYSNENIALRRKYKELEQQLYDAHKELVQWKENALLFMKYHKEKNGRRS